MTAISELGQKRRFGVALAIPALALEADVEVILGPPEGDYTHSTASGAAYPLLPSCGDDQGGDSLGSVSCSTSTAPYP
jgi:hypothetical protein